MSSEIVICPGGWHKLGWAINTTMGSSISHSDNSPKIGSAQPSFLVIMVPVQLPTFVLKYEFINFSQNVTSCELGSVKNFSHHKWMKKFDKVNFNFETGDKNFKKMENFWVKLKKCSKTSNLKLKIWVELIYFCSIWANICLFLVDFDQFWHF